MMSGSSSDHQVLDKSPRRKTSRGKVTSCSRSSSNSKSPKSAPPSTKQLRKGSEVDKKRAECISRSLHCGSTDSTLLESSSSSSLEFLDAPVEIPAMNWSNYAAAVHGTNPTSASATSSAFSPKTPRSKRRYTAATTDGNSNSNNNNNKMGGALMDVVTLGMQQKQQQPKQPLTLKRSNTTGTASAFLSKHSSITEVDHDTLNKAVNMAWFQQQDTATDPQEGEEEPEFSLEDLLEPDQEALDTNRDSDSSSNYSSYSEDSSSDDDDHKTSLTAEGKPIGEKAKKHLEHLQNRRRRKPRRFGSNNNNNDSSGSDTERSKPTSAAMRKDMNRSFDDMDLASTLSTYHNGDKSKKQPQKMKRRGSGSMLTSFTHHAGDDLKKSSSASKDSENGRRVSKKTKARGSKNNADEIRSQQMCKTSKSKKKAQLMKEMNRSFDDMDLASTLSTTGKSRTRQQQRRGSGSHHMMKDDPLSLGAATSNHSKKHNKRSKPRRLSRDLSHEKPSKSLLKEMNRSFDDMDLESTLSSHSKLATKEGKKKSSATSNSKTNSTSSSNSRRVPRRERNRSREMEKMGNNSIDDMAVNYSYAVAGSHHEKKKKSSSRRSSMAPSASTMAAMNRSFDDMDLESTLSTHGKKRIGGNGKMKRRGSNPHLLLSSSSRDSSSSSDGGDDGSKRHSKTSSGSGSSSSSGPKIRRSHTTSETEGSIRKASEDHAETPPTPGGGTSRRRTVTAELSLDHDEPPPTPGGTRRRRTVTAAEHAVPMTPRSRARRTKTTMSTVLPPSLYLVGNDDDNDDDNDDNDDDRSTAGSIYSSQSTRGRGRTARRSSTTGSTVAGGDMNHRGRSRSASVQGGAPSSRPSSVPNLNDDVPQTPNTQRKTLALAAMLYSKPDEFACQVAGNDDGKEKEIDKKEDGSQSPTSVSATEQELEPDVAAEMEKKAKLQQKKDYWKAKLAAKK